MTKREKISILKKVLKMMQRDHAKAEYIWGICHAVAWVDPGVFPQDLGINLPTARFGTYSAFCWPLTAKGAAIRRRVLKNAIKRLEK